MLYGTLMRRLSSLNGRRGSHSHLAAACVAEGLGVEIDSEDNGRSWILAPGSGQFWDRVVGVVSGDADAVIKVDSRWL